MFEQSTIADVVDCVLGQGSLPDAWQAHDVDQSVVEDAMHDLKDLNLAALQVLDLCWHLAEPW